MKQWKRSNRYIEHGNVEARNFQGLSIRIFDL